jgi:hypothetical protein
MLPEGGVTSGQAEARLEEAAGLVQRLAVDGEVVVKADLSTSGVGQVRIPQGSYGVKELSRRLEFSARGAPELTAWPVIVERWYAPREVTERWCGPHAVTERWRAGGQGGGGSDSCSAQCVADGGGGAELKFVALHGPAGGAGAGAQGFTAALGASAVGGQRAGEIGRVAVALGREMSAWGYGGVFGLDLVFDEQGGVKLLEVNARRTTLSAGGELLALAARDFEDPVVLFFEGLKPGKGAREWSAYKGLLSKLLFPIEGRREGWVPLPLLRFDGDEASGQGAMAGFSVAGSRCRALEVAALVRAALEGGG